MQTAQKDAIFYIKLFPLNSFPVASKLHSVVLDLTPHLTVLSNLVKCILQNPTNTQIGKQGYRCN